MMQVVCIYDGPWFNLYGGNPHQGAQPIKGCIYTVVDENGHKGIRFYRLAELECCWDKVYFRPVKKTSIEIFKRLLNPIKQERVNG